MDTPTKNSQAKTIKEAWEVQHRKSTVAGVVPHTWIMEYEASLELKAALKGENKKYQLFPSHDHHKSGKESYSYLQESLCGKTSISRPIFYGERMG